MKKIKQFDKKSVNELRKEMQVLFDAYGVKGNIALHAGNITYGEAECTIKVVAKIAGAMTRDQKAIAMFTDYAYGDLLSIRGFVGKVKLVAYKTQSPKYPYIVETIDGKRFKLEPKALKNVRPKVA